MNKKIITIFVLILAIIVTVVYYYKFKSGTVNSSNTVEGYVRKVDLDDNTILICHDLKNISNEEYMGDCYIPIEEGTVISDGRTLDSIKQGEHIIATYTGTLLEINPAVIEGTELIQFVN